MPWSGTGTYTRGYASWTSDATNGLPISATKFDTEDNDFAAGIQNCLTIDNQNKPNATLTWAQALNLTKGTDSTVLSLARTGGTNNPSLTWAVADSTNLVTAALNTGNLALSFSPSAYVFGNATDAPSFNFTGTGVTSTVNAIGAYAWVANTSFAGGQSAQYFALQGTPKAYLGVAGATNQLITGSVANDFAFRSQGGNIWFSVDSGATIKAGLTSGGIWEISDNGAAPTLFQAGYMALPQNLQSGNYAIVLADQAKQLIHSSGSAHTFTIPANASVPYPTGTVLHFVNPPGSGVLTIALTSDTLTLVPAGSTGSRTLTAPGVATAEKISGTAWLIYGSNLT
jgi:hypothetical protein